MAEEISHDSAGRGRPSDPGLQGRFIDAALELLTEQGYRALTMSAVARRTGASTASLYRRWSSKQALVTDIARTLTLEALGTIDTGTLEGDLREFVGRKRQLISRVGTPLLALLAEASHDTELRDIMRSEVLDATARHLGELLDRAAARGELTPPARDVVRALAMVATGSELLSHALSAPEQDSPGVEVEVEVEVEVAMILRLLDTPMSAIAGRGDRERGTKAVPER